MGSGGIDPKINVSQPTSVNAPKGVSSDKASETSALPSQGTDTASITPKKTFANLTPENQIGALLEAAKGFGLSPNAARLAAKDAFNKNQSA